MIAGCDPSSRKLAVMVEHPDGRITAHTWTSSTKKWEPSSCHGALEWVLSEFGDLEPGVLWLEEPVVGRSGRATVVQAFVSGATQAAFVKLGWEVRLVNVTSWKMELGKPLGLKLGRAEKDDVADALRQLWPDGAALASDDGDLVDAAGICLYGRRIRDVSERLVADEGGMRRAD